MWGVDNQKYKKKRNENHMKKSQSLPSVLHSIPSSLNLKILRELLSDKKKVEHRLHYVNEFGTCIEPDESYISDTIFNEDNQNEFVDISKIEVSKHI